MLNNEVINTREYTKVNNLFPIILEGLKNANKVDNITTSDLTHQAHDLQDQWSQSTNTKNTYQNNKDKKNTTTLIQQILNLCSKVVNFLTRIKKYLTAQIDKTLTSLKEGMQYCSQLLSDKLNNITTTAATIENSTASQNTTLPSQSTDGVQASTTMFAQANSVIPNRKTENIQPPAANIINNTRHGNTVPPPPPPPPPSLLANSVNPIKSQYGPQVLSKEEIEKATTNLKHTENSNPTIKTNNKHTNGLNDELLQKLRARRKGINGQDDITITNNQNHKDSTLQESANISHSTSTTTSQHIPTSTPPSPQSGHSELLTQIREGVKLRPISNKSTNRQTFSNTTEQNDLREHPLIDEVRQDTDNAQTSPSTKKQVSHVQHVTDRRNSNHPKQQSKSRS